MLIWLTAVFQFLGMALCLWMAGYLSARGFDNPITRRAALMLFASWGASLVSFAQLFQPLEGGGAYWSALFTLSLLALYGMTWELLPANLRQRWSWMAGVMLVLSVGKAATLLIAREFFDPQAGASAWIVGGQAAPLALLDATYQVFAATAIFLNFWRGASPASALHARSGWLALLAAIGAQGYGIVALFSPIAIPKLPMDIFVLIAVVSMGYAVAANQALLKRHITLQDLPLSGFTTLGLASLFTLTAWQIGLTFRQTALITSLAIFALATFEIVNEVVDWWLYRREGNLRRTLRALARRTGGETEWRATLQTGLESLCAALKARSGYIALRTGEGLRVEATLNAWPVERELNLNLPLDADLCPAPPEAQALWLAPVGNDGKLVGVVALGERAARGQYSDQDFDQLTQAADWAGRLWLARQQQAVQQAQILQIADDLQTNDVIVEQQRAALITQLEMPTDAQFVKEVEDALRHLGDYDFLARLTLATRLTPAEATHIERGKALRECLVQAIETLRPAPTEPEDPPSREWQGYLILRQAYVDDVPNRDIMAALYISEGTFNRQRRKAIQAVARSLQKQEDKDIKIQN